MRQIKKKQNPANLKKELAKIDEENEEKQEKEEANKFL